MTQTIICHKLAKYLELLNPVATHEIRKRLTEDGFCFGFSTCFSAMLSINKLEWWLAALAAIAAWDETSGKLDEVINLPQAVDPQSPRLQQIFERVLNYISYHQSTLPDAFGINELNQTIIFNPDKQYFEFVNNGTINKSIQRISIAGNFTEEDLASILDENTIAGSITLAGSNSHSIAVNFYRDKWIIYDPNYPHNDINKMYRSYANKNQAIKELIDIQGNAIGIQTIYTSANHCLTDNPYDNFMKNLSGEKALAMLDGAGLSIMAYTAPQLLPLISKLVEQLSKAPEVIAKALVTNKKGKWSGLDYVTDYAKEHLEKLLSIVGKSDAAINILAAGLPNKNNSGDTNIHTIARWSPIVFPQILAVTNKSREAADFILLALCTKNAAGWTGLQKAACYASSQLAQLIDSTKDANDAARKLAIEFTTAYDDGWTGLQTVARSSPQSIPNILAIAGKYDDFPGLLVRALGTKNNKDNFCIATVARYALPYLTNIFNCLLNSPATASESLKTVINLIKSHAPEYLAKILPIAVNILISKKMLAELCHTIFTYTKSSDQQCELFNLVLEASPGISFDILKYIPDDFNMKRDFGVCLVTRAIRQAETIKDLKELLNNLWEKKDITRILIARRPTLTNVSLYGHTWKGEEVSATWVNLMNIAKDKMIRLYEMNHFNDESLEDMEFLKIKTMERSFFATNINYYQKYLASKGNEVKSGHLMYNNN